MFCTSCGHELGPNDKFCPACGTANDASAQVVSAQADIPSVQASNIAGDAKVVAQDAQVVQEPVVADAQPTVQPFEQPISQPTQPAYQQPAYTAAGVEAQGERSKKKSITAVVLSGVGVFFVFYFYTGIISLVCGLIGLIMSIGAKKEDKGALPKVAFGLGIAASAIGFIEVIIGFIDRKSVV